MPDWRLLLQQQGCDKEYGDDRGRERARERASERERERERVWQLGLAISLLCTEERGREGVEWKEEGSSLDLEQKRGRE